MKLMPQEVEVRYILPTIRKEFALELHKRKISQKEIAKLLDLTPAAVSQYLNNKRASNIELSNHKEIQKSIKNILENKKGPYEEMYKVSKLLIQDRTLCKIHKILDKNIPEDCKICLKNL